MPRFIEEFYYGNIDPQARSTKENKTVQKQMEERPIGIYGQRRLRYLKQHHKILYYNLLTSGKLHSHLADVEEEAQALFSRLVKEYAEKEGVTEQLKSADQMKWVQKMNSIRVCVTESVIRELIFI